MTVLTNRLTTGGELRTTTAGEVRVFSVAPAQYWRILIRDNNGAQYLDLVELEFLDAGGTDLATGGTAFASSSFDSSYTADKAFDDNSSTNWGAQSPQNYPEHLGYDFGTDVLPVQVRIEGKEADRTPRAFDIQYSYDNVTWSMVHAFTGEDGWGSNEIRTYDIQPSSYAARISKANAELAYVSTEPKARISKAMAVSASVVQKPRTQISKANAVAVHNWPLVRHLPGGITDRVIGTDVIDANTITLGQFPAIVKGKARSVTVLPKETNSTVQFRTVVYGKASDGTPAGLFKLGDVVTGCTTDEPVDLPLPGGVDMTFGNFFVGLWADQNLSVGNTFYKASYKQNLTFGSDPGLTFSGSYDSIGSLPRPLVNVLQPDRDLSFGASPGGGNNNAGDQYAATTMILGRYYNLHNVTYQAATFTVESDNKTSARYRVAVYSDNNGSPGDLIMVSNDVVGAPDSLETVVTFPTPVTMTSGLYFLGVVCDQQITYATLDPAPTYTNASKFSVSSIDSAPDPAPTETGISRPPLVQLLYQRDPPILPGLKSPVLAVWSGIGDVGDNFVTDFSRLAEDGTLRVIDSGANRETEDASKDFRPYAS